LASRVVAKIGPRKTFAFLPPIQTGVKLLPFLTSGRRFVYDVILFDAVVALKLRQYRGTIENLRI
jgi:hypothetical protein